MYVPPPFTWYVVFAEVQLSRFRLISVDSIKFLTSVGIVWYFISEDSWESALSEKPAINVKGGFVPDKLYLGLKLRWFDSVSPLSLI